MALSHSSSDEEPYYEDDFEEDEDDSRAVPSIEEYHEPIPPRVEVNVRALNSEDSSRLVAVPPARRFKSSFIFQQLCESLVRKIESSSSEIGEGNLRMNLLNGLGLAPEATVSRRDFEVLLVGWNIDIRPGEVESLWEAVSSRSDTGVRPLAIAEKIECCLDALKNETSSPALVRIRRDGQHQRNRLHATRRQQQSQEEKEKKLSRKWDKFETRRNHGGKASEVSAVNIVAIEKFDEIMTKLKKKQMKRTRKTTFDLEGTFRQVASSSDGSLDQQDLCVVMEKLGVPLRPDDAHAIMTVVDSDGSGTIDIGEFAWIYYNRRKLIHGGIHATGGGSKRYHQEQAQKREAKLAQAKQRIKSLEESKRWQMQQKWLSFEKRLEARRKDSSVSEAKRRAVEKFDEIMTKLKKKQMKRTRKTTFDLEGTFRQVASSSDGSLDQQDLCVVMEKLGVPLRPDDAHAIMTVVDSDGSGTIDIGEFAWIYYNRRKLIHGGIHATGGGSKRYHQEQAQKREAKLAQAKQRIKSLEESKRFRLEKKEEDLLRREEERMKDIKISPTRRVAINKFEEVMGQLKAKVMLTPGTTKFDLEQIFRELDESGDGSLDIEEFRIALEKLGVTLTHAELSQVMLVIDPDGSGQVNIGEFAWTYYNRRKLLHGGASGSKHYREEQARARQIKLDRAKAHLKAQEDSRRNKMEQKWRNSKLRSLRKKQAELERERAARFHSTFQYFLEMLISKMESIEDAVRLFQERLNISGNERAVALVDFYAFVTDILGENDFSKLMKDAIQFALDPQNEGVVHVNEFLWILESTAYERNSNKLKATNVATLSSPRSITKNTPRKSMDIASHHHDGFPITPSSPKAELEYGDAMGVSEALMGPLVDFDKVKVYLMIVNAVGLDVTKTMKYPDSFVELHLGGYAAVTPTIWQDANPDFHHHFTFPEVANSSKSVLKLNIRNDEGDQHGKIIGSIVCPLKHFDNGVCNDVGLPLSYKNNKIKGKKSITKPKVRVCIRIVHEFVHVDELDLTQKDNMHIDWYQGEDSEHVEAIALLKESALLILKGQPSAENNSFYKVLGSMPLWNTTIAENKNDIFEVRNTEGEHFIMEPASALEPIAEWTLIFMRMRYKIRRRMCLPESSSWVSLSPGATIRDTRFVSALAHFKSRCDTGVFSCFRSTLCLSCMRCPGWLILGDSHLFFWGDDGPVSQRIHIPLLDLKMVQVHRVSFVRALHVYTDAGLWRFAGFATPSAVKQKILEKMFALMRNILGTPGFVNRCKRGFLFPCAEPLPVQGHLMPTSSTTPKRPSKKRVRNTPTVRTSQMKSHFSDLNFSMSRESDTRSSIGDIIDIRVKDFQVTKVIGNEIGHARGFVEEVIHSKTGMRFCMKFIPMRKAITEEMAREIGILEHVMHPFLLNSIGLFELKSFVAILSPFVPGKLRSLVSNKQLTEKQAMFYGAEVLSLLHSLHSLQVVHRGIEIDNVLVQRDGHVKVVNVEHCKFLAQEKTFTLSGNTRYMSPNRISGHGHGLDADLWSFGIFLFELIQKATPFDQLSELEMYLHIIECRFDIPESFSAELKDLIYRLMHPGNIRMSLQPVAGENVFQFQPELGSVEQVLDHPFFYSISWEDIKRGAVPPPYRPEEKNPDVWNKNGWATIFD